MPRYGKRPSAQASRDRELARRIPNRIMYSCSAFPSHRPSVIDNPDQVVRLFAKLEDSLPILASLSPPLAALIREQSPGIQLPPKCHVTSINYLGDEGGIVCKLDLGVETGSTEFFVSITNLIFDRRVPLGREILAYQKHRYKRLRVLHQAA